MAGLDAVPESQILSPCKSLLHDLDLLPRSQGMSVIYERWLACGEKWSRSSWVISMKKSHQHTKRGCRRWMTRKQIEMKYNDMGNGVELAQEIITDKEENGVEGVDWKRHPELTNRDDSQRCSIYI